MSLLVWKVAVIDARSSFKYEVIPRIRIRSITGIAILTKLYTVIFIISPFIKYTGWPTINLGLNLNYIFYLVILLHCFA